MMIATSFFACHDSRVMDAGGSFLIQGQIGFLVSIFVRRHLARRAMIC
jgi:hypothetical protein